MCEVRPRSPSQGRSHRPATQRFGPDSLKVPVSRDQVKSAPNIDLHGDELSKAEESTLYHHYQLNYTPPDSERGRRLARR
jgi:hypothetical protein